MKVSDSKKEAITPLLLDTATTIIRLKAAVLKRQIRRDAARRIHSKKIVEVENRLTKAIAEVIKEEVNNTVKKLENLVEQKSKTNPVAADLTAHVFNPKDITFKNKIIDAMLPILAVGMLKSMKTVQLETGVKSFKGLKFNPYHDPTTGRFSTGGGAREGVIGIGELSIGEFPEDQWDDIFDEMNEGSSVTRRQKAALFEYQGDKAKEINRKLRSGDVGREDAVYIKTLDKAISQTWLPVDMNLFRGVDSKTFDFMVEGKSLGDVIKEKGFISTSLVKNTAKSFGDGLFQIKAKKGQYAADVGGIGEAEILLPRKLRLKVVGIDKEKRICTVEIVEKLSTKDYREKFNPYHDSEGRFATGSGSGAHMAPDTGGGTGGGTAEDKPEVNEKVDVERESARTRKIKDVNNLASNLIQERENVSMGVRRFTFLYTGNYSKEVNEHLRNGNSIETLKHGEDAKEFMAACKQKISPTVVYRGVSESLIKKLVDENGEGVVVEMKGFVSTSLSPVKAAMFNWSVRGVGGKQAVMEIKAKSGLIAKDMSKHGHEAEFIQSHGVKYRYLGVEKNKKIGYGEIAEKETDIYKFEEI